MLLLVPSGAPPASDTIPTLTVEVAFDDSTTGDPTWTDVTDWVQAVSASRGVQEELGRPEAGTCNVVFDNSDRRFDPTYTSSPYYPYVTPLRRIRVRAYFNGVNYPLFTGYVERWPVQWRQNTSQVQVQCVDGFAVLANAKLPADTYPAETTGARIRRVLDAIGWDTTKRRIDTGQSQVLEHVIEDGDGTTALQHLQDVTDTELGLLFCDGNGDIVFLDRHSPILISLQPSVTFGDDEDAGELPYEDLELSYDLTTIKNDYQVTQTGGSTFTAEDATSIATYWRRTAQRTILAASELDCQAQAQFLVSLFKDPVLRFTSLSATPVEGESWWASVLGLDMGDPLTVKRRPPGGGNVISQQVRIQGVGVSVQGFNRWRFDYRLAQSGTNQVFVWDSSVNGEFDAGYVFTY